jgi:aspartyl-tRNA(Asn)/glutamyl-tRNA(Gln) amidotransferase subunit C
VKLNREQVMQIAELAKLSLSEQEIEQYAGQLSAVLDYASRLDALDTSDIAPTATVLPLQGVMRDDTTRPSLSREQALANAPSAIESQFRVSAVME